MTEDQLVEFFRFAYGGDPWPKPFHLLQGSLLVWQGTPVNEAAKIVKTSAAKLEEVATQPQPAFTVLAVGPADLTEKDIAKARNILAQLLIGRAAEIAFEDIYKQEMGSDKEFALVDLREGRTDTDYRLLNGLKRPLYRINIKFFGSTFRRGPELVELEPADCFPLATYKIHGALEKQEKEHLPYIFTIVGVPDLTAASIENLIPDDAARIIALIMASPRTTGKRNIQDKLVDKVVSEGVPAFRTVYKRIRSAQWYVLSARKADNLLREMLFRRVYAMRIRGFAQQFRGAELDMHFSLDGDLVKLNEFLDILRDQGQTKVASLLERGTI